MNRNFDLAFGYYKEYENNLKTKPSKFQKNKLISCFGEILDLDREKWKTFIKNLLSCNPGIEWLLLYFEDLFQDWIIGDLLELDEGKLKDISQNSFLGLKERIKEHKKSIKIKNKYVYDYIKKTNVKNITWIDQIYGRYQRKSAEYINKKISEILNETTFDFFMDKLFDTKDENDLVVFSQINKKENFLINENKEILMNLRIDKLTPVLKINDDGVFLTEYMQFGELVEIFYNKFVNDEIQRRLPSLNQIENELKSIDVSRVEGSDFGDFLENYKKILQEKIQEFDYNMKFGLFQITFHSKIHYKRLLVKILDYYNPEWIFDDFFENTDRNFQDKETAQLFEILRLFLKNNSISVWYRFLDILYNMPDSILNSKSELLNFMKSFGEEKNILDLKKMEYYLS